MRLRPLSYSLRYLSELPTACIFLCQLCIFLYFQQEGKRKEKKRSHVSVWLLVLRLRFYSLYQRSEPRFFFSLSLSLIFFMLIFYVITVRKRQHVQAWCFIQGTRSLFLVNSNVDLLIYLSFCLSLFLTMIVVWKKKDMQS